MSNMEFWVIRGYIVSPEKWRGEGGGSLGNYPLGKLSVLENLISSIKTHLSMLVSLATGPSHPVQVCPVLWSF